MRLEPLHPETVTVPSSYWRHREEEWRRSGIRSRRSGGRFTRDDYADLWRHQGGTNVRPAWCALCAHPLHPERWVSMGYASVGVGRGINVDHDHAHGYVRALLHGPCNRRVGSQSVHHASEVLRYLEAWDLWWSDRQALALKAVRGRTLP